MKRRSGAPHPFALSPAPGDQPAASAAIQQQPTLRRSAELIWGKKVAGHLGIVKIGKLKEPKAVEQPALQPMSEGRRAEIHKSTAAQGKGDVPHYIYCIGNGIAHLYKLRPGPHTI